MAGIGTGRGPLYMDIPVEPRYVHHISNLSALTYKGFQVPATRIMIFRASALKTFGISAAENKEFYLRSPCLQCSRNYAAQAEIPACGSRSRRTLNPDPDPSYFLTLSEKNKITS